MNYDKIIKEFIIHKFKWLYGSELVVQDIKQFKGRILFKHMWQTVGYIGFLDLMKEEYGIMPQQVTRVILERFDFEEWSAKVSDKEINEREDNN